MQNLNEIISTFLTNAGLDAGLASIIVIAVTIVIWIIIGIVASKLVKTIIFKAMRNELYLEYFPLIILHI